MRQTTIRTGLESLYFSGAHAALKRVLGGMGAILTLHRVIPARATAFQPNKLLEVTPDFLESVVVGLRDDDVDFVTMDEAWRRLSSGDNKRRFLALTFDDGYRDNVEHALPILRRFNIPATVYVSSSFAAGTGELWWLTLEKAIERNARIELRVAGQVRRFDTADAEQKLQAFEEIYWLIRRLPHEDQLRAAINDLAQRYGLDPAADSRELCLRWNEIAALSRDPLVTIGAHSVHHYMLRKVSDDSVRQEIRQNLADIEEATGKRPDHFAYPVGDPTSAGPREFAIAEELGLKTAVTTRPGMLFPEHRAHMWALPRISLNGEFQRMRYVRVLTSGSATALWNRFRRLNVG